MRKETYAHLEPAVKEEVGVQTPGDEAALSAAISLKRIADTLERLANKPTQSAFDVVFGAGR